MEDIFFTGNVSSLRVGHLAGMPFVDCIDQDNGVA
jgi:hypothetical protein